MTPITDLNDLPDVVEVLLIAGASEMRYLPTGPAQVWAYRDGGRVGGRGTVPGPLIEAKQGDRVIVHFRNELPEGTTVHWHGLRVSNVADGSTSSQHEVPPGGEYLYEFIVGDPGTFWYHPHVRGDTQVERGLYGMIIVRGGPRIVADAERAFVLDDVKLNANGTLSDSTTSLDIMLGRLGNFVVVNGAVDSALQVVNGSRERWRIVNSANGRYFNLRLPGHSFRVIAWDGGLLAAPYSTESVLVAPGERYDLLVDLEGRVGTELALETIHYDRGHDIPDPGPQGVLKLDFTGNASSERAPLSPIWGSPVTLLPPEGAVEHRFVLDEHEINSGLDVRFTINDKAFPEVPLVEGREGDIEIWAIENRSEMDHPFHLHGMFFRVLDVNGVPPEHVGWKDTVNVPQTSTLRFVVQYGDPGAWVYHCHILEHQERGMMGELRLHGRDAGESPASDAPMLDAGDASWAAEPDGANDAGWVGDAWGIPDGGVPGSPSLEDALDAEADSNAPTSDADASNDGAVLDLGSFTVVD